MENAEIDLGVAKQARYPNLGASSNLSWNFGRTIDPTSNDFITETFFSNNYGINSGIVLFDGFRIKNNISRSELNLKASEADAQQTSQDIALNVAVAYLNILFTRENIDIAQKQLELNEQQLARTIRSIEGGILPAAEKLNVESQIAQSEQGIIVAQNSYEIAVLQLKQLLRLDPSKEIEVEVPEDVEISTDPDLVTLEELTTSAIKMRYDLIAAEYRNEIAMKDVELAKSGYYPTLSLFGNLRTNYSNQALEVLREESRFVEQEVLVNQMPVTISQSVDVPILAKPSFGSQLDNFLSYGFGFGLNVPIYNNGITKGNVQKAKLNIQNMELQSRQLKENLIATLQQRLADARAAKKKLEASDKSLAAQKASFENVGKRLEIGAANSFEWESQKTQLENLEIQRLNDKYDYLFKIKILEFYLGKPLKF